jgi:hypothetical protein
VQPQHTDVKEPDGGSLDSNLFSDIDECLEPNDCNGVCHNTLGGYYCTSCPHGKVFEPTKRNCVTTAKQHSLLLGEFHISTSQLPKCICSKKLVNIG